MFRSKKSFRKEFKRQVRLAIVAGIGFTVAFAWRNAIYDSLFGFVVKFTETTNIMLSEVYTAIFISIFAAMLIYLTSKLLKD